MAPNFHPLSQDNLAIYLDGGSIYTWVLAEAPDVTLTVNVPAKSLAISGKFDGSDVDIDKMRNCDFKTLSLGARDPDFTLTVGPVEDWYAYYSFLELVVKKLLEGRNQATAINEAIDVWNNLVSLKPTLGQEQEVGLMGELLLLRFLVETGNITSLSNWTGPEREEHDFKFNGFDIEVKTTTQESRVHIIGSLSQLKESAGKQLFLLSNQLTKTGPDGFTLGELVRQISSLFPAGEATLFQEKLRKSKYLAPDEPLYKTRWELRSRPRFYQVDDNFPRLLPESLGLPEPLGGRVFDVSYRVNLEGLPHTTEPFPKYMEQLEVIDDVSR